MGSNIEPPDVSSLNPKFQSTIFPGTVDQRRILLDKITNLNLMASPNLLLYGNDTLTTDQNMLIFQYLYEYIETSNRFT